MNESENEAQNPLSEENWTKQNNCKFIKYVIHHRHHMTPEQLKQKPFKEIFKNQLEKVDTEEGESTKVQEEFTTSEELTQDDIRHFQTCQNKIVNQTLMLMRLNTKKIHKHLNCKFIIHTTQQCMMKMI